MTAKPETLTPEQVMERLRQFHGHLGPYAVLGHRIGERLLEALKTEKYSGLSITVTCTASPPYTCLLDGLQVSTGCTMGKQNLRLIPAKGAAPKPPFRIVAERKDGARMTVLVLTSVPNLFKDWLAEGFCEVHTFHRIMGADAALLWKETSVQPRTPPYQGSPAKAR